MELEQDTQQRSRACRDWTLPARYRLSWLCFGAAFFGYAQRYGLALAIVRMQAELQWDRSTQGRVLAAFFLGYMLAMLPAGYLAASFGPRKSITVGLLVSAILTLLLPLAAVGSPWSVAALRVLQGLAQGVLFPGFAALWSSWAPPLERSRLDGLPRAGGFCGAMACTALGGWQCDGDWSPWLFGGWQGVFTLWGVFGLAFAAVWWILVADTPDAACASVQWMRRTGCSFAERMFVREAIGEQLLAADARSGRHPPLPPCSIYLTIGRSTAVCA